MKHDVVVHKARLPLAKGESINQFTQRLSESARKYAMTKLSIQKGGAYMCEAYDDSLVMDVYKRPLSDDGPTEYKYYSVAYTRKDDGQFTFGPFQEVERVTSFKPKAPLAVSKAKVQKPFSGFADFGACVSEMTSQGKSNESARKICGSLQAQTEKSLEFKPGWVYKSMWGGLL